MTYLKYRIHLNKNQQKITHVVMTLKKSGSDIFKI